MEVHSREGLSSRDPAGVQQGPNELLVDSLSSLFLTRGLFAAHQSVILLGNFNLQDPSCGSVRPVSYCVPQFPSRRDLV